MLSHKMINRPIKFAYYGLVIFSLLWVAGLLPDNIHTAMADFDVSKLWKEGSLPFFGMLMISLFLGGVLPHGLKERFVHFRWSDPLPGSRAFTRHAASDSRIDLAALEGRFGAAPIEPKAQNAHFYKIYKTCRNDPAVAGGHRNYLLFRDLSFDTLLLALIAVPSSAFLGSGVARVILVLLSGLVLSLSFAMVANNYSHRFVCNALANADLTS